MVSQLFDISGKTALITGAGQGIGRSIALALAEYGANVVINYRSNDALAEETCQSIKKLGRKAWLWKYDLLSNSLSADFCSFRKTNQLNIDILVLNASIQVRKAWNEVTLSEFNSQMIVNLRSSLELIQCCVPNMISKAWGRIVTLGSVQQSRPSKQMIVYAASKAGQYNMVKNLARQLGDKGITINNLAPGVISTIRNRDVLSNDIVKNTIEKSIPLGYIGEPNDLASMALLLCSDAGRYITGADIYVDGGMSLPE